MTVQVDLYYTMRSPYCYLATPQLKQLNAEYDLYFQLKPVYPLAVSDNTFFTKVNPLWPPYVACDTARIAQRLAIPFRWPQPDPIVQDRQTRKVAAEQPYIRQLTHLAQLAAEQRQGLEYVCAVSALLFSPEVSGWDKGDHLQQAMQRAGFDLPAMQQQITEEAERLEAAVQKNRAEQLAAGHWGAPLFVADEEIFFGRDRIEDLLWFLQQRGLQARQ